MKNHQTRTLTTIILGLLVLLLATSPAVGKDLRDWGVKIDKASSRFKVLKAFNNEAVLDKETQLVWQRTTRGIGNSNWTFVRRICMSTVIGDRKGWRLPSLHELASLIDPSQNDPALPTGHPFQLVQSDVYWTATTSAFDSSTAFTVDFSNGRQDTDFKGVQHFSLCVRGGSPGPDAY